MNESNIIISDFNNLDELKNIILTKNIKYILPLSNRDYNLIKNNIKKINNNDIKILYPTEDVYKLLDNKNSFTEKNICIIIM